MTTQIGSSTSMSLGTVVSRYVHTAFSKRGISIVVWTLVTPSSLTKDKMAPGGIPRLRRPTRVKRRGSSQPLTYFPRLGLSGPSPSTNLISLRFDRIVPLTFRRPYLLKDVSNTGDQGGTCTYSRCIGLYTPSSLQSQSYDSRDSSNSVARKC